MRQAAQARPTPRPAMEVGLSREPTREELEAELASSKLEVAVLREQLAANKPAILKAVIDNAPVAIIVTDAEARITMTNPLADRLYARPIPFGQDYQAHAVLQLCYPDGTAYVPRDLPLTRSALDGETCIGLDLLIRWPDGQERHLLVNTTPIRDAEGRVAGAVGAFEDITERRQLEQALSKAHDELGRRIQERTVELVRAEETLRASQEELRAYARRLVEAVENERRALARELHDVSGQALTVVQINLGLLQQHKDCSADLRARVEATKEQIDAVMQELHRLSRDLRPISLDKFGLHLALKQLVDDFGARAGIGAELAVMGLHDEDRLPPEIETATYRIVQESLTNVTRHARATNVSVFVRRADKRIQVIVEDDGRGFDVAEAHKRGRLGLVGMYERAEMLGGTFAVESRVGAGTTTIANIPLDHNGDTGGVQ